MNVPDGWKLVPIEPTVEMINAMRKVIEPPYTLAKERHSYAAMLAATPAAVVQAEPSELTDAQIRQIATDGVRDGKLSWLGFDKDANDSYTIPILSACHYQLARLIATRSAA